MRTVPQFRNVRLGTKMFIVSETPVGRVLTKVKECRKIVTVNGEIQRFGKKKSILLPLESKIAICKVNHWEMQNIRMTKNRINMRDNSNIVEYELGEQFTLDEERILLSSLEVLEIL